MKKATQAGSGKSAYQVFQGAIRHVLGLRPQVSQAEYLSKETYLTEDRPISIDETLKYWSLDRWYEVDCSDVQVQVGWYMRTPIEDNVD